MNKKTKEPVRIRFKELENGNKSIYLDIYKDGKRQYRFLKLYLIPEKTPFAKAQNKNTLQAVEAIKAQMVIDLANGEAGIKTKNKSIKVLDWLDTCLERKRKGGVSNGTLVHYGLLKKHLKSFKGNISLCDIDSDYIVCFTEYLTDRVSTRTTKNYLAYLGVLLNMAVKDGLLECNPMKQVRDEDRVRAVSKERCYLTIDELRLLMKEPIATNNDTIKAFLFSCFCGLRYSDIEKLVWGDIFDDSGQLRARVVMKKTKEYINLPLSENAVKFLPERGEKADKDKVFDLPHMVTIERHLKQWSGNAVPNKHITFHTARHTFATMMLTLGADLYTTSKLLGHANINTTQIYAKIVDKKRDEAVNLTNGIF